MPDFTFERKIKKNYRVPAVAGVDEVGRGALAGPLVAAAVILDTGKKSEEVLREVNDSKVLTSKKREKLSELIKEYALDYSVGIVEVEEIDYFGVGAANILAFKRALDGLSLCQFALIDGRKFHGFDYPFLCLEKGESKSLSIAAASIVAKVFRDELMKELDLEVPAYNFARNKGYGGGDHLSALRSLGPSIHHRQSFLKSLISRQSELF